MKIDGKKIADKILEGLRIRVKKLQEKNVVPQLAIIVIGDDPASLSYVRQKELKAASIGIKTSIYNLESRIQNSELLELIKKLNADKTVHGIVVQQPLPQQINLEKIINSIDPKKDVDGFNQNSKFEMPIAMATLKILEEILSISSRLILDQGSTLTEWLQTKQIVIIGKGKTGGGPIIRMLEKMQTPFTVIDSKTLSPEKITKQANIIISAVGKANILRPEMIRKGVILIGVGISRGESAKLMGDYDWKDVKNIASFYTPTPGGVGPVDVAMLLKNLVSAASS